MSHVSVPVLTYTLIYILHNLQHCEATCASVYVYHIAIHCKGDVLCIYTSALLPLPVCSPCPAAMLQGILHSEPLPSSLSDLPHLYVPYLFPSCLSLVTLVALLFHFSLLSLFHFSPLCTSPSFTLTSATLLASLPYPTIGALGIGHWVI
jgi:hypothetical protein